MATYSDPCDELEAAVKTGRVHHNNNKVFNWMASNLSVIRNTNAGIKPTKATAKKKIDGMTCAIMGVGRAMGHVDDTIDLGKIKVSG